MGTTKMTLRRLDFHCLTVNLTPRCLTNATINAMAFDRHKYWEPTALCRFTAAVLHRGVANIQRTHGPTTPPCSSPKTEADFALSASHHSSISRISCHVKIYDPGSISP
ncbi:hypothetical protein QCA50_016915 [Cerrena zonata]|uniref:Uncharacterized protein n=1 Tax=Cerrena zonata TaxID=2478898 RepID=A0AAW0FLY4_9APHY